MKNLLVISILLFFSCTKTIKPKKNHLDGYNLKGSVKLMSEFSYKAIEKNGEILKGNREREDNDDYDVINYFNANGNLTKTLFLDSDSTIVMKSTHKYDSNGNEVELNRLSPSDTLDFQFIFKYDEKGRKNEEIFDNKSISGADTIIYKFDKNDNPIESYSLTKDGDKEDYTTYKYDEKGNETEFANYRYKKLDYKEVYTYDDKGNKIEEKFYNSDGYSGKYQFTYDDLGNNIEKNYYNPDGSLNTKTTFKYEFDSNKNWIKRIDFKDGVPIFILERKIEYY